MYLRGVHAESDIRVLRRFIRENPLGILISSLPSPNFSTLQFSHIPWLIDVGDEESDELGTLLGHMSRLNPHAQALSEASKITGESNGALEHDVAVVFTLPIQEYVPPKFFVETKPSTGKCVPTWNYAAVQVYGKATILWDSKNPATGGYLQEQITALTKHAEENIMHFTGGDAPAAWEVSEAPKSYVDLLKRRIMGIKIKIERLEGKFKMTQEMGNADRQGVVEGYDGLGTEKGYQMARLVEERGAMKDTAKRAAKNEADDGADCVA